MGTFKTIILFTLLVSCDHGTYKRIGVAGPVHVYEIDGKTEFLKSDEVADKISGRYESDNATGFGKPNKIMNLKQVDRERLIKRMKMGKVFAEGLEIGDCFKSDKPWATTIIKVIAKRDEGLIAKVGSTPGAVLLDYKNLSNKQKVACELKPLYDIGTCIEFDRWDDVNIRFVIKGYGKTSRGKQYQGFNYVDAEIPAEQDIWAFSFIINRQSDDRVKVIECPSFTDSLEYVEKEKKEL